MAYSDGNSVALTPDYGFNIASPVGLPSGGYPVTLAIAFKPAVDTTNDRLIGIARASGNHWVILRLGTGLSGLSTTATVDLTTRAGGTGSEVLRSTTATVEEGVWSIIVAKFTDANNWKVVIDDNALETFGTVGGASPTSIDTFYFVNGRDVEYLDGSVAWGAVWFSALSDADMQSIAAGTTPPSDHAPNELIYFESTTAIEGENGSTVNQTGAGSIAVDETDPAGWPPEAEGGSVSLTADSGTLTLGGGAALFTEQFNAEAGSLTLVGANAVFDTDSVLDADPGTLTLIGQDASVEFVFLVEPGELTLTGADAVFDTDTVMTGQAGTLSLSGEVAFLQSLLALSGTINLGGGDAVFSVDTDGVQPEVSPITLHAGPSIQTGTERNEISGRGSLRIDHN